MTSIFQMSNPFPSTLNPPTPSFPKPNKPPHFIVIRATSADKSESKPTQTKTEEKTDQPSSDQSFDSRLANVRLKYRSGTGKKAEKRRSKKTGGGVGPTGSNKSGTTVMLPPVPLQEPVNAQGLKVEPGFTAYSEMLNGRVAALGLAALVLVELASGKGLFKYHLPPILFVQMYTVAAAAALFIKFEKERISVWPVKAPAVEEVLD